MTMIETANIEIVEPFVRLGTSGDEGSLNLDEETSRALYALAWEKLESALVQVNALYNLTPDEGQESQRNRVKRLLWEASDLKAAAEVLYYMTALPEDEASALAEG